MTSEIRAAIRGFVLAFVKDDLLDDDENMFELGYVNSLFAMQLVMFVEKTYGFSVPRDDLKLSNFQSIDAIVALVEERLGSAR
ncbi:MAG: acyl carrier protein [Rhodospirillaceae bacterium]|nr:acyl carrier protein [Rhodospirillaceae bacterium]MEA4838910.1 acyl carrier protein [Rhodospirillaceae bacterium]